jgi:hypothetical protein
VSAVALVPSWTVVCPELCSVPQAEHLPGLREPFADDAVLHKSAPNAWATVAQVLGTDGSSAGHDEKPRVLDFAQDINPIEVDQVIRDLQAAVAALRT